MLHVPIENTLSYNSVAMQDPILVNLMGSIAIHTPMTWACCSLIPRLSYMGGAKST